jgi:hypothetical protein
MSEKKYYYLAVMSDITYCPGHFVAGGFTASEARHRACEVDNTAFAVKYGKQPKGCERTTLKDWTVLKINLMTGTVEQEWAAKV